MKSFVRDATIRLKFRFHDATGEIRNPTGANVSISYLPHGDYADVTTVTYPLARVVGTNDWLYEWDSHVAKPCVITAHAETTDVPPVSAVDTQFRLTANAANRDLVGEL